jgi:hypothetical protein
MYLVGVKENKNAMKWANRKIKKIDCLGKLVFHFQYFDIFDEM